MQWQNLKVLVALARAHNFDLYHGPQLISVIVDHSRASQREREKRGLTNTRCILHHTRTYDTYTICWTCSPTFCQTIERLLRARLEWQPVTRLFGHIRCMYTLLMNMLESALEELNTKHKTKHKRCLFWSDIFVPSVINLSWHTRTTYGSRVSSQIIQRSVGHGGNLKQDQRCQTNVVCAFVEMRARWFVKT